MDEPAGATYFTYSPANLEESIHYPDNVWNYFYYDSMLRR